MDTLVRTLSTLADPDDLPGWEVTHNGVVIAVRATSRATFDNPDEAYAEGRRMVTELLADGSHRLVNHAEIGAVVEPVSGYSEWRGRIDVLLWPSDQLAEHHQVIEA